MAKLRLTKFSKIKKRAILQNSCGKILLVGPVLIEISAMSVKTDSTNKVFQHEFCNVALFLILEYFLWDILSLLFNSILKNGVFEKIIW